MNRMRTDSKRSLARTYVVRLCKLQVKEKRQPKD